MRIGEEEGAAAPGSARASVGRLQRIRAVFLGSAALELGVLVVLFLAYSVVRSLPTTAPDTATDHALAVLAHERWVFRNVEIPLNHWLTHQTVVAVFACYVYAVLHYFVTPAVLLVARRRDRARYWRGYWAIVIASLMALVIYALYPVAPPRLVPHVGSVDVMMRFASYGWWGDAASAPRLLGNATNQYAAMPSLHFGWALWCGIMMWGLGRRWWRVLAVAYPGLIAFVVVSTGNHFTLDVAAGAAVMLTAFALVTAGQRALQRASAPSAREPVAVGESVGG